MFAVVRTIVAWHFDDDKKQISRPKIVVTAQCICYVTHQLSFRTAD